MRKTNLAAAVLSAVTFLAATSACTPLSALQQPDLSAASILLTPENIPAHTTHASTVTVTALAALGVVNGVPESQLEVPGCTVTAIAATLDPNGQSTWRVENCTPGLHEVSAAVVFAGFSTPLPALVSLNAYAAAAESEVTVRAGNLLNLQIVPTADFTGTMTFVSSDPAALLPPLQVLAPTAAAKLPVLVGQLALYTAGQQTVQGVDPATQKILLTRSFSVGLPTVASGGSATTTGGTTTGGTTSGTTTGGTTGGAGGTTTGSTTTGGTTGGTTTGGTTGGTTTGGTTGGTTTGGTTGSTTTGGTTGGTTTGGTTGGGYGPAQPLAANSQVDVTPATAVAADGSASATITVTLRDINSTPVAGEGVALGVSGSTNTLAAQSGTTSSAGVWSTTLTSTTAEVKTLTAAFGGQTLTSHVTFAAGAMAPAHLSLVASPNSVAADGTATTTLVLHAADAYDNPISGVTTSFSVSGSSNALSQASPPTDASGNATVTLASTAAESKTITAGIGGTDEATTVVFTHGPAASAQTTLSASPSTVPADGTTAVTLTATIRDAHANPVPQVPVVFTATGSRNVFRPGSAMTNSAGVATSAFTTDTSGPRTFTAATSGASATSSATVTTGPAYNSPLALGGVPVLMAQNSPQGVALGDINNDGHLDVGVVNYSGGAVSANTVQTYLGYGNGFFQPPVTSALWFVNCYGLVFADLDADGDLDAVVTSNNYGYNWATALLVLTNDGTGTLTETSYTEIGANQYAVQSRAGDLNGDGFADIVTAAAAQSNIIVSLATGTGSLNAGQHVSLGLGNTTVPDAALGDLDGDGRLDAAVIDSTNGLLWWAMGQGDGTFGPWTSSSCGGGATSLALADINGDGPLDAAVASGSSASIAVLYGTGTGGFAAAQSITTGTPMQSVSIGEVTGGGTADLVGLAVASSPVVSVLPGIAGPAFSPHVDFQTVPGGGNLSGTLALGQLNGDARKDAVFATRNTPLLVVLMSGSTAFLTPQVGSVAPATIVQVVAGDFDRDGHLDAIAISADNSNPPAWLPGNGSGILSAPQVLSGLPSSWGGSTADLNADSKLDLVLGGWSGYSGVRVALGNGDGSFATPVGYPSNGTTLVPVAGDVSGDGVPDIVAANYSTPDVSVFIGHGDGTFAASVAYATSSSPAFAALADFNRDGKLDIAVAQLSGDTVDVLLNTGSGAFAAATSTQVASNLYGLRAADFNGDGTADLVMVSNSTQAAYLLAGVGDGTFHAAVAIDGAATQGYSLAVADLNGDALLDVVFPDAATQTLRMLRGRGDGTFSTPLLYLAGVTTPQAAATGDYNGDGRLDVVLAGNGGSNNITVLLNAAAP